MAESGKDVERSGFFFFSKILTTFSHKRKKNSKRQYGNGIHSALELPSTPLCRSPNAARALHHLKNLFDTLST